MTKKYNEIEVKNNMNVEKDNNEEEVAVQEKEQLTKMVATQPKKVKRSLFGRLVNGIMGPEGLPSIGTYVNEEIVKPAIKNIIVDAVTSGINMVMYGEKNPRRGQSNSGHRSGHRPSTNYSNYSRGYAPSSREPEERRTTVRAPRYGVDEYIIDDRYDAAHVLTSLQEYADKYDVVSVADYYEAIGITPKFTDNNYGWTIDSISHASIVPVRSGYVIKFPQVEVI